MYVQATLLFETVFLKQSLSTFCVLFMQLAFASTSTISFKHSFFSSALMFTFALQRHTVSKGTSVCLKVRLTVSVCLPVLSLTSFLL